MRLVVVLHLDPCPQTEIELIDRRHAVQIQALDQLAPQRSPESFDLPFRRCIPRPAVHQVNAKPSAQQPQVIAAEAGMVIQQKLSDDATAGNGLMQHPKKTFFCFTKTGFQIRDQPAAIVEQTKDDRALRATSRGVHQQRTMQRIALPEFSAHGGLPAISCRVVPLHARDRQAVPMKQPLHARHTGLAHLNPSRQFQFPQNQVC